MLYVIAGEDAPDSLERRKAARGAHLERLRALKDKGRLIIAGPCPAIDAEDPGPAGFTGSVIVAEFDSLEEAKTWAGEDSYVEQGVFSTVTVRPFLKVLP